MKNIRTIMISSLTTLALAVFVAPDPVNAGPSNWTNGFGGSGATGPTGPTGPAGATGATGPAGPGGVTGTLNTVAKFTSATTVGDSNITDDGTSVSIGGIGGVSVGYAVPVRFYDPTAASTNYASFVAPALVASTVYTWPPDDGAPSTYLKSDGGGVLTWSLPTTPFSAAVIYGSTTASACSITFNTDAVSVAVPSDGLPVILYRKSITGMALWKCLDAACATCAAPVTVNASGDVGPASIGILADGRPFFAYTVNAAPHNIVVGRCDTVACATFAQNTTLIATGDNEELPAIAVNTADNTVGIVWGGTGHVYTRCLNPTAATPCSGGVGVGNTAFSSIPSGSFDYPATAGHPIQIAFNGLGFPVLSYQGTTQDISTLACNDEDCSNMATSTKTAHGFRLMDQNIFVMAVGIDGLPLFGGLAVSGGGPYVATTRAFRCSNNACTSASQPAWIDGVLTGLFASGGGAWAVRPGTNDKLVTMFNPYTGVDFSGKTRIVTRACINSTCSTYAQVQDEYPFLGSGTYQSVAVATNGDGIVVELPSAAAPTVFRIRHINLNPTTTTAVTTNLGTSALPFGDEWLAGTATVGSVVINAPVDFPLANSMTIYEPVIGGDGNFTRFSTALQTTDIRYTLPATAPTISQYLKATDGNGTLGWATFPAVVTGSETVGSVGRIAMWTGAGATSLKSSQLVDDGTNVGQYQWNWYVNMLAGKGEMYCADGTAAVPSINFSQIGNAGFFTKTPTSYWGNGIGLATTSFNNDPTSGTAGGSVELIGFGGNGSSTQRITPAADLLPNTGLTTSGLASGQGNLSRTIYGPVGFSGGSSEANRWPNIRYGVDTFPVISYTNETNADLEVVHCLDKYCATTTRTVVDSVGDVGRGSSIAIGTDTFPIVSYTDVTNGDIKVAHCVDIGCVQPATITVVDAAAGSTTGTFEYTGITIGTDTFPVIVYVDVTGSTIKVAKCSNVACTAQVAGSPRAITTVAGISPSIVLGATDTYPIISYITASGSRLHVVHCTATDCATYVDTNAVAADYYSRIAMGADGFAVVAYYSPNAELLHCTNTPCTSSASVELDALNSPGTPIDVGIGASGFPIAMSTNALGYTRLYICGNASCSVRRTLQVNGEGNKNYGFRLGVSPYDGTVAIGSYNPSATVRGEVFFAHPTSLGLPATLWGAVNVTTTQSKVYTTATNCSDSAGPAACGSAAAGAFVVDAAATTVVVSTTAVDLKSRIMVMPDSSLGAELGVTCNVTVALPTVTARTPGTSFTVTVAAAPVTDPACYSYWIVN